MYIKEMKIADSVLPITILIFFNGSYYCQTNAEMETFLAKYEFYVFIIINQHNSSDANKKKKKKKILWLMHYQDWVKNDLPFGK